MTDHDIETDRDALTAASAELLRTLPDAHFEIDARGAIKRHLGGAATDDVLQPANLVGKRFGETWPRQAADLMTRNIRRALRSRSDQAFTLELAGERGSRTYEVRLVVHGRERLLAIFRCTAAAGAGTADPSFADTLTGLTRKDRFLTRFAPVLADARLRERGLALMCIDIDRFSRINETLGRAVGDAVLKVTARRIQGCFRDADNLVRLENESDVLARVGADEFVLVLTGIAARSDVVTVADRVQQAFAEPVSYGSHALTVTPSIGIAQYPVDGADAELLLARAREALDEAKTHGENGRAFYSGTMKLRALGRFDQKDELRWAMEADQLRLHYLPRIDLETGGVIGLEALLRWIHPMRGSVPLGEILPLAEATGLILPIGEWILDTACQHASTWAHGDLRPVVSINLSQQEFARDDLPDLISRALDRHALPGERLQLDLTESMLMRHNRATRQLRALKDLGVRLVIDNFGTGHSSLIRLKSLPIDALKIDRSFVEGIDHSADQRAICGAIMAMARELGFRVIAEGVETDAQLDFLRKKGCNAAQGFFYTQPLPPEDVAGLLDAWTDMAEDTSIVSLAGVRERIVK